MDTAVSILYRDAFVNLHWGWGYNIGDGGDSVEEDEAQLQHKE